MHVGSDDRPVATGTGAIRLPLPGGWTATAGGAELRRVIRALGAVTAPEREAP